jgi:hypothetical protein
LEIYENQLLQITSGISYYVLKVGTGKLKRNGIGIEGLPGQFTVGISYLSSSLFR